jgi:hypothetical protein
MASWQKDRRLFSLGNDRGVEAVAISAGNWIETDPKKGWFTILCLYRPLEPFFTRKWRPSEIELVK